MQELQINGEDFNVINELNELSIKKFNELIEIFQSNSTFEIEKQVQLVKVLSNNLISEDDLMDLPMTVFENMVELINIGDNDHPIQDTFTYDNVVFTLKGDSTNFIFTVNQSINTIKAMREDDIRYVANMMSFIYENKDFSAAERATIFNDNMTMDYATPFLQILRDKYEK